MQLLVLLSQDNYAFHEPARAFSSGIGEVRSCKPMVLSAMPCYSIARLVGERQRHRVKGSLYQSYV